MDRKMKRWKVKKTIRWSDFGFYNVPDEFLLTKKHLKLEVKREMDLMEWKKFFPSLKIPGATFENYLVRLEYGEINA